MNALIVLLIFLAVRLSSVFIVQTYFVPDEYWQSLEVAHKITFGYGYLTWEWIEGIRCYVYPLIIAGVYKLLALSNFDNPTLLILAPRILQALLSAYSDYRFYVWTGKKKWSVFLIIAAWFWFYTGSRTLANTLEASLTTVALSYYPWTKEKATYLWPAALCCYLRPTATVIWIPLCIKHLNNTKYGRFQLLFKRFLPISILVAAVCIAVDSYVQGTLIVTPYEFIKHNVWDGIGSFYGTHPWYWYFTVGLPTVLGINIFPFLFGIIDTIRHGEAYPIRKTLIVVILITLSAYSLVEHKEFRFVLPLLPMCLYICADTLTRWSYKASRVVLWMTAIVILASNIGPAWYLSSIHQRGPTDLMIQLQDIAKTYKDVDNNRANILFLMPCHSTPYYSHIHENVTMRFLTCQPNLGKEQNYTDEADQFYEAPDLWLRRNIPVHPKTAAPTHLVLFEPLSAKINDFLNDYNVIHKIPHAEYASPRTGRNIIVFEKRVEQNIFNKGKTTNKMESDSTEESDTSKYL